VVRQQLGLGGLLSALIAAVAKGEQAELDYDWPNPVAGKVEDKHTFLRKVGLRFGVMSVTPAPS
jgi:hypothetical protein